MLVDDADRVASIIVEVALMSSPISKSQISGVLLLTTVEEVSVTTIKRFQIISIQNNISYNTLQRWLCKLPMVVASVKTVGEVDVKPSVLVGSGSDVIISLVVVSLVVNPVTNQSHIINPYHSVSS